MKNHNQYTSILMYNSLNFITFPITQCNETQYHSSKVVEWHIRYIFTHQLNKKDSYSFLFILFVSYSFFCQSSFERNNMKLWCMNLLLMYNAFGLFFGFLSYALWILSSPSYFLILIVGSFDHCVVEVISLRKYSYFVFIVFDSIWLLFDILLYWLIV